MEAGTLRFEVYKPKINWGALFRNAERSTPATAGQWENYSGGRPGVTVYNSTGDGRLVEATNTVKEARRRVVAIEQDFKTLGAAQWCARYDVPLSFVSG
jgi:hypothetical protein